MLGDRSPALEDIHSRLDILKGQLHEVTKTRLDPTMLSKAHDLISVEGNILAREGRLFYINSSNYLVQDSIANKMSIRDRVLPYESKAPEVITKYVPYIAGFRSIVLVL